MISRRSFLAGLGSMIAAPAIVHAANLMPVRNRLGQHYTVLDFDGACVGDSHIWKFPTDYDGGGYKCTLWYDTEGNAECMEAELIEPATDLGYAPYDGPIITHFADAKPEDAIRLRNRRLLQGSRY